MSYQSKLWACVVLPLVVTASAAIADELDALISPNNTPKQLVDQSATAAWNQVVEAFRKNDMVNARQHGQAFLNGDFKSSPYQLLGVKVMMKLAGDEGSTATTNNVSKDELSGAMSERAQITAKYARLNETIRSSEAVINKLTNFRRTPVQQGTQAYYECVRNAQIIERAQAELEALKPQIEKNKADTTEATARISSEIKADSLRLLDMLIEANELEAAFAIGNVYIRKIGDDLDIAKKQQDVIRLQEDQKQADKIVAVIRAEVEPLVSAGKSEEAESKLKQMIAKVEASSQSDSVKKMMIVKLKATEMKVTSAIAQENRSLTAKGNEMAEIVARLDTLEMKLDDAQNFFGTLIRSIDGFAEFRGEFKEQSDKAKATANLQEKVKSGAVSKEKLDNLIKAKSQHLGILREVEILQSESSSLSVVQRGRLANLQVTAKSALDLLEPVTR